MRNLYLVLIVLLVVSIHNNFFEKTNRTPASITDSDPFSSFKKNSGYVFKYVYLGEELVVKKEGYDSISLFKEATRDCFKHFSTKQLNKKNENIGQDIIDVCANPR